LVDGEHYPPVMRDAIAVARRRGHDVVAALLVGGSEKLEPGVLPDLGVRVAVVTGPLGRAVAMALHDVDAGVVLDLSDEPVLGYRERMEVAAAVLAAGVVYEGPDFRFTPPAEEPAPAGVPTLAVVGTGKRTGKTAIAGEVARQADRLGREPIMVAMGRGGPAEPQIVEAGTMSLDRLLAIARDGNHAASDYLEGALTTGVTTVGARRAGGGLAGAPFDSNVVEAVAMAAARRPGLLVLEGSGAALPPIAWDAGILVVPAACPSEYLMGYFGPYRLLRTDLAIVTMARDPVLGSEDLSALTSHLRGALGDARYVVTDFFPEPLADVGGRDVFLATTAPGAIAARHATYLADTFGCRVVGWSARLADRVGLAEDLDSAHGFDVLLTELKAAAVDVACERAMARGADIVFVDNRARVVDGETDLVTALHGAIELATVRGSARGNA
ncbi:MAG: cyclic 2,3-diphosphoglycerate synthetase, partial [Actinomycetota bacterium]